MRSCLDQVNHVSGKCAKAFHEHARNSQGSYPGVRLRHAQHLQHEKVSTAAPPYSDLWRIYPHTLHSFRFLYKPESRKNGAALSTLFLYLQQHHGQTGMIYDRRKMLFAWHNSTIVTQERLTAHSLHSCGCVSPLPYIIRTSLPSKRKLITYSIL